MKTKPFYLSIVMIAVLMMSCSGPSTQDVVKHLNGYWTIYKVKKENGDIRQFKGSPAVDYIQVDSTLKGIRVKVQPQLNGSFKTTKDKEHFTVKRVNDSIRLYYKTPMASWVETLVSISENKFKVKDTMGMTYTYKRFESLQKALKAHQKR